MNRLTWPMLGMLCLLGPACTSGSDRAEPSARASTRQCFFPSQVTGYTNAGDDRIHVQVGPGSTYLFETFGDCDDLRWSEAIGFDNKGSATICSGLDVTLIVPTTIGPRRCPVRMIRKLTREEARARKTPQR